jgi:hypothetical protein
VTMIREEEGDLTQEMRMLVVSKADELVLKHIQKIEDAKPPITDEWTEGVNVGMNWAIRILRGDKSAS